MLTSKVEANYHESDNSLEIIVEGETVRTVSPIHMNTYKFKIEGKEYYFLFEEVKIRNRIYRYVYLYPMNDFENNRIDL